MAHVVLCSLVSCQCFAGGKAGVCDVGPWVVWGSDREREEELVQRKGAGLKALPQTSKTNRGASQLALLQFEQVPDARSLTEDCLAAGLGALIICSSFCIIVIFLSFQGHACT